MLLRWAGEYCHGEGPASRIPLLLKGRSSKVFGMLAWIFKRQFACSEGFSNLARDLKTEIKMTWQRKN